MITTIKNIFTQDENKQLQMFIEKVNKNDDLKAEAYSSKSVFVNPSTLRIA
jgi:5-methylthioribose kinase